MKKLLLILSLFLLGGCAAQDNVRALKGMPEGTPVKKIHILGQNCIWSPSNIEIQEGTHVILEIESMDIPYDGRLSDYDLRFKVPAGKKVSAEFYASQKDRLEFGCRIERNFHYQWGGIAGKLTLS